VDGVKRVKIGGEEVPVRAELYTLGGLSAHADQAALLSWLGHFSKPPRRKDWRACSSSSACSAMSI